MRWLAGCFYPAMMIGCVLAQSSTAAPHSSDETRVVRVQIGYICGWCGGAGYRTTLTTVDPHFIVGELADAENPRKNPNRRQKRAITKREWQVLVRSIDAKALRAVPQDGKCRPCIDRPDSWVEIVYSDGSKLAVHYPPTGEPAPVKALKFPVFWMVFYP